MAISFFSNTLPQSQSTAQREHVVFLSQGAPLQTWHFVALLAFSNPQRVKEPMEALLPSRETAEEPTQLDDLPRAVHSCCDLTVHDSNFLSTLLILLLGTYLVPYSYPSHW